MGVVTQPSRLEKPSKITVFQAKINENIAFSWFSLSELTLDSRRAYHRGMPAWGRLGVLSTTPCILGYDFFPLRHEFRVDGALRALCVKKSSIIFENGARRSREAIFEKNKKS